MERAQRPIAGLLGGLVISEERRHAGRMAGMLYVLAGCTSFVLLALPHVDHHHREVVALCGLLGLVWGLACLTIVPWERAPASLSHLSTAAGFPAAAVAIAGTGGADSPARFYLLFILVYAAYFYPPREAWPHVIGCVLVLVSPLFYDGQAVRGGYVAELVVLVPTYMILGALLMGGKSVLVSLREQATDLARHDSLTGLANRRALMETLDAHALQGRRGSDAIALVMLDIDDFKSANTRFGHQGGDLVLQATARGLQDAARAGDVVARLGGDEFAVVAHDAHPAVMREITERLLQSVREAHERMGDAAAAVTASAGWACYPEDAGSVEGLIAVADRAMRQAKGAGKDRAAEPTLARLVTPV